MHNSLANPPDRIRNEARATLGVELAGSMHQADVPFVNQIGQGQAMPLVLERHLHHEAQIALDEFVERLLIPLRTAAAQFCLFRRRKQRLATHFSEVRG
jgi:hypothetical protein